MTKARRSGMKAAEENVDIRTTTAERGEAPTGFRKYTSLSAMKAGDGSFRNIFTLSRPTDKSTYNGPSMREVGPQYYLREEIRAAREAVNTLDKAVSGAQSFREKATKLLEEAHRALGRLEQAVAYKDGAPELIVIACEIKCAARRGITLVDVYGKYNTLIKVMTLFMRSFIHSKFDKQVEHLKSLIPPSEVARGAAAAAAGAGGGIRGGSAPQTVLPAGGSATGGAASLVVGGPLSPLTSIPSSAAGSAGGVGSSLASAATTAPPSLTPQPQAPSIAQQPSSLAQSLGRSSVSHQQAGGGPSSGPPAPLVGTMLRPNKHDRVYAMAYVPPSQSASSEYVCIWWSAGQMLEFYSEATQSTTGFQIEKSSMNVTALGIDEEGNVWTGHGKGMVRVRPKQQWEFMVEDKPFSSAVKAITFDEAGRAWIGDDSGRIKVLGYDPRSGKLDTVASLQRSPALLAKMKGALADTTRGLFGKRHCTSSGTSGQASAAAVFAAATAAAAAAATAAANEAQNLAAAAAAAVTSVAGAREPGPSSAGAGAAHNPPVAIEGPVRCIFLRGGRAWTSGGKSSGWLQLWDANSFQDLDVYDCCGFGPCHSMASVRWPNTNASAPSSYHPGMHTRTPSDHARLQAGAAGGVFDAATAALAAGAPPSSSWRLLTGHENGQLLLWHPDHKGLAPLLRIGEIGSPCRGIATFDTFRLVATGHQNGELHVFLQPSAESGLPPGSESVAPQSFGTMRPRMVTIQAHKSRVDRMAFSGTSCVTASMLGTIRLWHAADLAQEAQRHGLLTHTASYGSLLLANNGGGAGPGTVGGGPGTISAAPSMQTFGTRYSASTSVGELSAVPSPMYPQHQQQPHRDSTKRLVQEPNGAGTLMGASPPHAPAAAGAFGSPHAVGGGAGQQPQYGTSVLVGASTISTNLSAVLSGSAGSGPQQLTPQQLALAAGSASHHHTRQGSKDSSDTVGGTITQPSSTGTQLAAEAAGGSTASQQQLAAPVPSATFPHFQTIDASELSMKKLIGSGAYGKVWLAEWTGCQVAVKELFGLQGGLASNDKEYMALMNEVTLLGSLSHPNIMRFLAMCLDPPLIVMQYYPHGSLFDLLHRAQKGSAKAAKELSWGKRLDMLRDVAAGMQYLHSRKPPVIHGDLRSPNLLLDLTIDHERPRFHVKIADFGLARMATGATGSVMVSKTTNPRWLAPEVIKNSSVGKAADVYSFAIIMWEMLTWQQPYEDMMSVQVMFSTVTENSRPDVPPESQLPGGPGVSLHLYRQLMESCWHADAAQRPSFKEVVECFQGMQRVEAEAAKQQRQQQQQQQGGGGTGTPPHAAAGRRSRGPSETGYTVGPAPGSSGSAAAGPEAPRPSSTGSVGNAGGVAAAAAGGAAGAAGPAAARRAAAGPGVASPFQGTSSPFQAGAVSPSPFQAGAVSPTPFQGAAVSPSPFHGAPSPFHGPSTPFHSNTAEAQAATSGGSPAAAAAPAAAANHNGSNSTGSVQQQQQYGGSVLALYAISPILEEQMSSMTTTSAATAGAGGSHTISPADSRLTGGTVNRSEPHHQGSPPQPHHPHAAPPAHLHPHPHPHPHVQFAPSAFAAAAGAAAEPEDEPVYPAFPSIGGTRVGRRGTDSAAEAAARTHPPSSASSAEGPLGANAISAGSNAGGGGGPSTASSSRQSSTSNSGRNIGAAAAAAVAAAAAAPAATAAMGASGPSSAYGVASGRKAAGPATRQAGASAGTSAGTPRRDGGASGAAAAIKPALRRPGTSSHPATPGGAQSGATAGQDLALWESPSMSAGGMTALSPFASLAPAQIGELDSAAPRDSASSASSHLSHPHNQHQHQHPGASSAVGAVGRSATMAATAVGGTRGARVGSGGSASSATGAGGSRGRIPGPSFGPGLAPAAVRTGHGPSAGGAAARGVAPSAHSQPGTPPFRCAPSSPMSARAIAGGPFPGSRTGSITGASGYSAGNSAVHGAVQRSGSGDGPAGPPPAGSRATSITGAPVDPISSGFPVSPSDGGPHRAGSGAGGGGQRQSFSAAHVHLEGVGDAHVHGDSPGVGTVPGRPTHRRTPSGGSVPHSVYGGAAGTVGHAHGIHGHAHPAARTRDLLGGVQQHPPQSHRDVGSPAGAGGSLSTGLPRTPTGASRTGRASPRTSAPSSGGGPDSARSVLGFRRLTPGAGGAPTVGSTSVSPGGLSGLVSPSAPSSGHLSRLGIGAASSNGRPPASPRSYLPGGPGSVSAKVTSGIPTISGGGSRIPSLSYGNPAGGQHATPPTKSTTSRSLDDLGLGLRRMDTNATDPGASAADAAVPASPGPAGRTFDGGALGASGAGASAGGRFAAAATGAAWDDGLGVRHSPDATQEVTEEVCYDQPSAEYARTRRGEAEASGQEQRNDDSAHCEEMVSQPPDLPRIATARPHSSVEQAAPQAVSWQPPALRTAAVGGSPFATAAYSSPFQAASRAEEEPAEEQQQQQEDTEASRAGIVGPDAAQARAPLVVKVPPATGPFAKFAAQCPFAQQVGDQDSWWGEQHQHYDN